MDLMTIGNTRNYIKGLKLKDQWESEKASGAVLTPTKGTEKHRRERAAEYATALSYLERMRESGADDTKLQTAVNKVYSGKKLTPEEKEYLKEKSPETYAKAVAIEQERKSYERALKRCRTEEEVQRLKMNHLSSSMTAVGEIKNNPHISNAKKLELILAEKGKLDAMDRTLQEFVRRGYYADLLTEAERQQAEEALEAERDPIPDEVPSEKPPTAEALPGQEHEDAHTPLEGPGNRVDSPDQEALRKIKRAKAVAAYAQLGGYGAAEPLASTTAAAAPAEAAEIDLLA